MGDVEAYEFSVDFQTAVASELSFLQEVDQYPSLYAGPILKYAIFRYETLWLPLAAEHRGLTLTAPLDIAWVWHCHLLSPVSYVSDCVRVCHSEIDHSLTPNLNRADTEKLWTRRYPDVDFVTNLVEAVLSRHLTILVLNTIWRRQQEGRDFSITKFPCLITKTKSL